MSWLSYVFFILAAWMISRGARKGFLRMALSMGCTVLVLLIAVWLNPRIGDYIRSQEKLYGKIEAGCAGFLEEQFWNEIPEEAGKTTDLQQGLIEKLPIPEVFREKLAENNTSQIYELLRAENFKEYLAGALAYWICSAIAFAVTFFAAYLLAQLILCALDLLTGLPGISLVNTLGGMGLGLLQAVIILWVLFVVVTIFCNTDIGSYLLSLINGDTFLNSMYENNIIMKVLFSMIGV